MALKPLRAKKILTNPKVDYGTIQDFRQRLEGSVVRYKGEFVYVSSFSKDPCPKLKKKYDLLHEKHRNTPPQERKTSEVAELQQLLQEVRDSGTEIMTNIQFLSPGKGGQTLKVDAKDLDVRLFPLGFINRGSNAVYTSRIAAQQWKQGITNNNIYRVYLTPHVNGPYPKTSSKEAIECYEGKYPTIQECLTLLFPLEGINSQAFSRYFALTVDTVGHITLYHHRQIVGSSSDEGETFKLMGRFKYLKEELTGLGVKIQ